MYRLRVTTDAALDQVDAGRAELKPDSAARPWLPAVAGVLAVALPVGLLIRAGLNQPVNFDGALNLQVADNIANGLGFVRDYGGIRVFPDEIQTGGYYVLGEALAISVIGRTQLALHLGNFVAIAVLGIAAFVLLRGHRWWRLAAPAVVLLAVPKAPELSLGGVGEYIIAASAVLAVILVVHVPPGRPERHWAYAGASGFVIGIALTIKVVAVAALAPLLLGLLMTWWAARISLVRSGLAMLVGMALPVIAFEVYRWVALGGWTEYADYWAGQLGFISYQAGLDSQSPEGNLLAKAYGHAGRLAAEAAIPRALLLVSLALPIVAVAALWLFREGTTRAWLEESRHRLVVALTVYACLYFAWWFLVTPSEKAWLRRLIIALIVSALLYVVTAALLTERLRSEDSRGGRSRLWVFAGIVGAMGVVLLAAAGPKAVKQAVVAWRAQPAFLAQSEDAADWAAESGGDREIYGIGWWSAPVVSLGSGVGFGDLTLEDPCEVAADDVVMWDFYAQQLVSPEPRLEGYEFESLERFGGYATVYAIRPLCPTAEAS